MTVTNEYDADLIKKEIVNDLRANITDPSSRYTADTALFDGDNSNTEFLIDVSNGAYVSSVEYPVGTPLSYGTDYDFNLDYDDSGTIKIQITFTNAPATGTENIKVYYGYGTNWIYPDYPKTYMQLSDFPRIAVEVLSTSTEDEDLEGATKNNDTLIEVMVYSYKNEELDQLKRDVRKRILNNQKGFYRFPYIKPTGIGPLSPKPGGKDKVMQRPLEFSIPYYFEVVS